MPSLLPGFEYDIFISYRQKDNLPTPGFGRQASDGWVSEFVASLTRELEATFKESVSIYFDANPHDGLLETHNVDKSLEGKLKCLIFIPIVSQTYCDPKSFAWEHEFVAFNRLAKEDLFGRDIKLNNGNVASRILPVKIHDLDEEDKTLVEQELGGVLRSVDFIYKSAGVNRPLRASEDHPQDNLNKTYYRDQINKVANSVKEIIGALKKSEVNQGKFSTGSNEKVRNVSAQGKSGPRWMAVGAGAVLVLAILGYFFILPKFNYLKDPGSSGVAVLPFRNFTGDEELNYYGVGMASEIRTKLSMSKQFSFISSLQATLAYVETKKTPKEIGNELGVDYLLSGLYQKAGNKIKVEVELTDATTGRVVWTIPFENELVDIFQVQTRIAGKVLEQFSRNLVLQENDQAPTNSLEAYACYTRGRELYLSPRVEDLSMEVVYRPSIQQFEKAIQLDSGFIDAWAGLVEVECYVYLNEPSATLKSKIEREVSHVNSHFKDSWQKKLIQGEFAYRVEKNYGEATDLYLDVLKADPDNTMVYPPLSGIYRRQLNYNQALHYAMKQVEAGPGHISSWKNISVILRNMGNMKNAMKATLKAWEISRKRSDAEVILWNAIQVHYPLDQLPDELKKDAGNAFAVARAKVSRNWVEVKKLSLNEKDYTAAAEACWALGQKDSARYWARIGLKVDSLNLSLQISSASDLRQALDFIARYYRERMEGGNDREAVVVQTAFGIIAHSSFGHYRQATEMLVKLNNDFPEFGWYEWLDDPIHDKIKKEYPPFQEALNNLKRKPLPDVSRMIKY